jgi:DNA adenine methylase
MSLKTNNIKPIIKWVGGKTQILDKLLSQFPTVINNYHEIFVGGGSVLFGLLSQINMGNITVSGNIYAYDANAPLIYVYKNIQTNHIELYNETQKIINEYNSCDESKEINRTPATLDEATRSKESYYYWTRMKYNTLSDSEKLSVTGSAIFIFLNKTCFRGVFRVGPNGFNVPFGHYDNPQIICKTHITEINKLIQNVIFESCDFRESMLNIKENDFAYCDPPYAPETNTSFVKYTEKKFTLESHQELFNICNHLASENKKIMVSNADVTLVRNNFSNSTYSIIPIICKRAINSKHPESTAKEVIIKLF